MIIVSDLIPMSYDRDWFPDGVRLFRPFNDKGLTDFDRHFILVLSNFVYKLIKLTDDDPITGIRAVKYFSPL